MLGDAELESFRQINPKSPGVLDPNRVRRPGVKRLRHVLAEEKRRSPPKHESPQGPSAKGPYFEDSREHVASKHIAGRVRSPIHIRIPGALIGIDLIVGWRQVELRPCVDHVLWKKHAVFGTSLMPNPLGPNSSRSIAGVGTLGTLRSSGLRPCHQT